MIVVKPKDAQWIIERVSAARRVAVLGCNTCAAVCFGGGERQVEELCCSLQIALRDRGQGIEGAGVTCERVCDWEFVEPVEGELRRADVIVSLACGAGSNLVGEKVEDVPLIPGVDTVFLGTGKGGERWEELCAACGDCTIDQTFGICPVARCAKTLLNGPCGGSLDGHCEVNEEAECAWAGIIERARATGRLEELERVTPPKDWSSARHGGKRTLELRGLTDEHSPPDSGEVNPQGGVPNGGQ